jgi:hypothetical protein
MLQLDGTDDYVQASMEIPNSVTVSVTAQSDSETWNTSGA